jgi:DNA-binding CsgD family transcriptional regulator
VRPCGLTATRWDYRLAWACSLALVAILLFEVVTPSDVVASLALIPLVAAMWALSARFAARVALVAAVVFGVALATEVANRPTIVFVVVAALVISAAVRFYATGIAGLWPAARRRGVSLDAGDRVEALTRRELEIASLASRGYTAGEIGARLHISDRTVESHLANAYAKLAIHSRSGLRELSELVN